MPQNSTATRKTPSMRESSEREREQLRRWLRRGAMCLIGLLLILLLAALFMPIAASAGVSRSFQEGLQASTVISTVRGNFGWKLLAGRTDSLEIRMEFDGGSAIALSELRASWPPSNVALGLIREGNGGARDAEPAETELAWDGARLMSYLNRVQSTVLVSNVEITPEAVTIYGMADIAGAKRSVMISGRPYAHELGEVTFTADRWSADGLELTEQLRDDLCAALSFSPDLAPLAWKVWPRSIELADDWMIVYGSSSCCN